MRTSDFGFESENERRLPKSTQPPKVEEKEHTCLEKPKKKSTEFNTVTHNINKPVFFKKWCCVLLVFFLGLGTGFCISWLANIFTNACDCDCASFHPNMPSYPSPPDMPPYLFPPEMPPYPPPNPPPDPPSYKYF